MSTDVLSAFQPARARSVSARALRPRDLESLAERWQRALDAGDRALQAAAGSLPSSYLAPHRRALLQERRYTAELLLRLARQLGIRSWQLRKSTASPTTAHRASEYVCRTTYESLTKGAPTP